MGLIILFLADIFLFNQIRITPKVFLGFFGQGLTSGQVGLDPFQIGLIGRGIDGKEQGPLADVLAFLKMDLFQLPGDPGFDGHRRIGLHIADAGELDRDGLLKNRADGDRNRPVPADLGRIGLFLGTAA